MAAISFVRLVMPRVSVGMARHRCLGAAPPRGGTTRRCGVRWCAGVCECGTWGRGRARAPERRPRGGGSCGGLTSKGFAPDVAVGRLERDDPEAPQLGDAVV